MPAYININDLLTRDSEADLISLTRRGEAVEVDAAVINQAIASAQAEVDSYLAGRLRLPLLEGEVSASIKHFTLIIARYYVYADRKTEAVTTEYERAVGWLRDVAAGRASHGVTQALEPSSTVTGSRVFAPVRKPTLGDEFERRYDVPMGPNGSGEVGLS